jgi:hypothetical protein
MMLENKHGVNLTIGLHAVFAKVSNPELERIWSAGDEPGSWMSWADDALYPIENEL